MQIVNRFDNLHRRVPLSADDSAKHGRRNSGNAPRISHRYAYRQSGKTVSRDAFAGLEKWSALVGSAGLKSLLIYGGSDSFRHRRMRVVSWTDSGGVLPL